MKLPPRKWLDVERLNVLIGAVASGVPMGDVCQDADEESYYRELEAASKRLEEEGSGRTPVHEWP